MISSAETLLAGQNANLPSTTDSEPLIELDSTATDTISLSSSTTRPAFALLQLTVAGLPLLATSPATVLTVLATDAYKSVLEAQRKVCLAFLTSDAMSRSKSNLILSHFLSQPSPPPSKNFPPSLPCTFTSSNRSRCRVKDRSGRPMLLLPTTRTSTSPLSSFAGTNARAPPKKLSWTSVAWCLHPDAQTFSSQIATTSRHLLLQPG